MTTILALSISLSGVISVALPSLYADLSPLNDNDAKTTIFNLLCLEAIIVSSFAIPSLLLFKDHPPTPPRHHYFNLYHNIE